MEYSFISWNMQGRSPYIFVDKIKYLLDISKKTPNPTFLALQEMGNINHYIAQEGDALAQGPLLNVIENKFQYIQFDRPSRLVEYSDSNCTIKAGTVPFKFNKKNYTLDIFQKKDDGSHRLAYGLVYPSEIGEETYPVYANHLGRPLLALLTKKRTVVCCLHAPANYLAIETVKELIGKLGHNFIICGDFNCDLSNLAQYEAACTDNLVLHAQKGTQGRADDRNPDSYTNELDGFIIGKDLVDANPHPTIVSYQDNYITNELLAAEHRLQEAMNRPDFRNLTMEQIQIILGETNHRPIRPAGAAAARDFISYLSDHCAVSVTLNIPTWN